AAAEYEPFNLSSRCPAAATFDRNTLVWVRRGGSTGTKTCLAPYAPSSLPSRWARWPEIHIHEPSAFFCSPFEFEDTSAFNASFREITRIDVVDRHGPELLHRRIGRDAQTVRFSAVEPVPSLSR